MADSGDIRFLLAIRDSGSLLGAARKLGVTPSAISQRLQALEKQLALRLIDRSARRLRLTSEGDLLCRRGSELVQQFDALFEDVQQQGQALSGSLKINAPLGFGRRYLTGIIADFQQAHPDIDIALTLSDQPLAETIDRFDVVVHIGQARLSNLIGHALAPNARLLCASPGFVRRHGMPASPEALAGLPCIVLRENNEDVSLWHFQRGQVSRSVRVSARLSCNDGEVIRRWACAGRGIILRSEWDVADDLAAGRLVRLLPGWKAPDADVVALTHDRARLPLRIRHFTQFLQERFRPAPPWRK